MFSHRQLYVVIVALAVVAAGVVFVNRSGAQARRRGEGPPTQINPLRGKSRNVNTQIVPAKLRDFDTQILANANELLENGRTTFRFDTFGDEAFWGGTLQLHQAIKGANLGGVGPGISPSTALTLGLKVDVDALPQPLINKLK